MLRKIGNKLDVLEEEIFEAVPRKIVRDISNVKQEIHQLPQGDPPQRPVLRDLEKVKQRYWRRRSTSRSTSTTSSTPNERIWDMLENYKEVRRGPGGVRNESVISHRVNDILRVLTSISVIVLPLTLLASIWGHERARPWAGEPDRLLRDRRGDGHPAGRHGRLLPPPGWL